MNDRYKPSPGGELTARSGAIVAPRGCAHEFEVLDSPAVTCYLRDGPFDPTTDPGVRWKTPGIVWKTAEPVVSDGDSNLPRFETFESPCSHDGAAHVG